MRFALSLVLCCMAAPLASPALGPHELLVLVNETSAESVEIGEAYARLRHVPPRNVLRLRVPAEAAGADGALSQADFARLIWNPVRHLCRERGLERHVLAWAYATAFPVRVSSRPPVSLTGMTFVRGRLPEAQRIRRGLYASPLFAGPHGPGGRGFLPQTLDRYAEWLGGEMPVPAMLLGYTGAGGNRRRDVLARLERSARCDATAPTGTVYFVTSDDVRSRSREWQYAPAALQLARLGVGTVVTDRFPAGRTDVLGLLAGEASPRPERVGRFLPGSLAEHLTSLAAVFDNPNQTKLTAWLKAGACASAGTVTEPTSVWSKFPHARFFVHYASGCCMIESFYQSVRCPLQTLPVGDPLASPWARPPRFRVALNEAAAGTGALRVRPAAAGGDGPRPVGYRYFIDGRPAGNGRELEVPARELAAGARRLRVVGYASGLVRHQHFVTRELHAGGGARGRAEGGP